MLPDIGMLKLHTYGKLFILVIFLYQILFYVIILLLLFTFWIYSSVSLPLYHYLLDVVIFIYRIPARFAPALWSTSHSVIKTTTIIFQAIWLFARTLYLFYRRVALFIDQIPHPFTMFDVFLYVLMLFYIITVKPVLTLLAMAYGWIASFLCFKAFAV